MKGSDYAPSPVTHGTTSGTLGPLLQSPVQETATISRGAHEVQGEVEGVKVVQPGEEEAKGGSNWLS